VPERIFSLPLLVYLFFSFNTDGIDVSGHNVHVHDVSIWNQDDCIAVKDNYFGDLISSNMTFERIKASGLGLVIGSIGGSTVRNITFRDTDLYHSFKGIYLKFRYDNLTTDHRPGLIEDILFENITMEAPEQWGIWIGPAQQSDG
jgi:polygalacturonase